MCTNDICCEIVFHIMGDAYFSQVCHASRNIQIVCMNKYVTSFAILQRKIYLGCTDSSIQVDCCPVQKHQTNDILERLSVKLKSLQEVDIDEGNEIEIRAPKTCWKMRRTPINSICVYKDWLYSAGAKIEGSNAKVNKLDHLEETIRMILFDLRIITGLENAQTAAELNKNVEAKYCADNVSG